LNITVFIIIDEKGRELEMITQWKESYERLRKQMKIETIIASPSKDFSMLTMVTDAWVPSCDVWIGDYPYLKKDEFIEFTSSILNNNAYKESEELYDQNQYNNNSDYDDDVDSFEKDSIKWIQDTPPLSRSKTQDRIRPRR